MRGPTARAGLAVIGASVPLAGLVWWSAGPIGGDLLFHLARMRKLAELDALPVLGTVNEFQDGSLHPGYAFPLWHGAVALIARVAGADVVDVALYLPAILVPLAVVLAYGAGTAVFRRPAGGVALVVAQVAQLALSGAGGRSGTGVFELLASPPTTSRVLLAPTILALAFAVIERRSWPLARRPRRSRRSRSRSSTRATRRTSGSCSAASSSPGWSSSVRSTRS